ncbi:BrnT family toxin [Oxalobacteraceae bacterium A2-2]
MEIRYDPSKDRLNKRRHGIALSAAKRFDWSSALIWPDDRFQYDELRECGLGVIGVQLHFISFVEQPEVVRVISLRRATKLEEKKYAREFAQIFRREP